MFFIWFALRFKKEKKMKKTIIDLLYSPEQVKNSNNAGEKADAIEQLQIDRYFSTILFSKEYRSTSERARYRAYENELMKLNTPPAL